MNFNTIEKIAEELLISQKIASVSEINLKIICKTLNINLKKVDYVLHDVSAQKNRRKKWIYKFEEDVRVVVFMIGMDQYNEPSRQNGSVDGVTHGLADFLELCEEPALKKCKILIKILEYPKR